MTYDNSTISSTEMVDAAQFPKSYFPVSKSMLPALLTITIMASTAKNATEAVVTVVSTLLCGYILANAGQGVDEDRARELCYDCADEEKKIKQHISERSIATGLINQTRERTLEIIKRRGSPTKVIGLCVGLGLGYVFAKQCIPDEPKKEEKTAVVDASIASYAKNSKQLGQ